MNVDIVKWDRQDKPVWDMPPLHWVRTPAGIFVNCPNSHTVDLEGRWDISAEGKVTPSIHCLTTVGPDHDSECGWHVFATLQGYKT